jgi:hypothetical protein
MAHLTLHPCTTSNSDRPSNLLQPHVIKRPHTPLSRTREDETPLPKGYNGRPETLASVGVWSNRLNHQRD